MPGETLEAALDAASAFVAAQLGTVLTELGERVTNRDEAAAVEAHYVGVADAIRARHLPTQLSVKLTHLGLDIDRDACVRSVTTIAERTTTAGSFLWIDMEESQYVDATLDVFRRVRAAQPGAGLCLQAYLRRTPADLESLAALAPAIRLVKGAYREAPAVAFPSKRDVDAAYVTLGERLLTAAAAGGSASAFGTHDLRIIDRLGERGKSLGLAPGRYEVHMLYGIKTADQQRLARSGVTTRVLISYGTHWFPWYMRRLAERPANVWFVARNLLP